MLAFIPIIFPLVPLVIGGLAGGGIVAVSKDKGSRKRKLRDLKERIEKLESKKG